MWFSADQTRKFAFVLGIGTYSNAPHLQNPAHDAEAVAAELQRAGYVVETWIDLDKKNIEGRLDDFIKRAGVCDTLLIYYSGHGIQLADGASIVNYIVPKDFSFDTDDPILELVSVQKVLERMAQADDKIIFLDACRDTAGLERTLRTGSRLASGPEMGGSAIAVSGSRGIGVEPRLRPLRRPQLDVGTFLAFSSEAGERAEDGTGHLSPFTQAVVRYLGTRGLDVVSMAQYVARDVRAATGGHQVPWTNSNLVETCHIYDRDDGPKWIMGIGGAASGVVSAVFLIDAYKGGYEIKPPILIDVWEHPLVLLSSIPLGITLGIGAYMWGAKTRAPGLGVATGVLFVVIAAVTRLWFASVATHDTLKPIYEKISEGDPTGGKLFSLDYTNPLWLILVMSIIATSFIGMSTIMVSQIFIPTIRDIPRLANGAFLGFLAVPLFLLFAAITNISAWVFHGLNAWYQIAGILVAGMIWEGALGVNAGWAYTWHVPLPDIHARKKSSAAPAKPTPVDPAPQPPRPPQAVDRFFGPAEASAKPPNSKPTGNRGSA